MNFPHFPSKLPQTGTSIFTVMSALAQKHQAINLSQGFPDFDCDRSLTYMVNQAIKHGHNQYAPMPGLPWLKEEISAFTQECYGTTYDPETEITITSGATEAIYCAITATVNEGDEVIVIEPAYDSYIPNIKLNGGSPVCYTLEAPDFRINWDHFKRLITNHTRLIILNTPHNPTGTILHESDIRQLAAIIKDTQIMIVSDEVYEHIIFDGKQHQSISRFPELVSRSFVISSFGKTLHTTGWKLGYCLAPPPLTKELRKVHQFVTFSTSTPFQHGVARYMKEEKEKIIQLKHFYQAKRDLFLSLMKNSRFEPIPCSGTYFQLMKYDQISDKSDTEFSQWLTSEVGVACIPVSVFYRSGKDNKIVRVCFTTEDETLEKAAEILVKV